MIKSNHAQNWCATISRTTSIAGFVLAGIILWTSSDKINDAFYFLAAVLVAGSILLWEHGMPKLEIKKEQIAFSCLLSLYFLLFLSCHSIDTRAILNSLPGKLQAEWLSWSLKGVLAAAGFISVFSIVSILFSCEIKPDVAQNNIHITKKRALAIFVFVSVIFVLSNHNGWSYPDYMRVWNDVHAERWNEWHTIGYLLFVKVASMIWDNMSVVSVLQTAIWLFVNSRALRILEKKNSRLGIILYTAISLALYIPFVYLQAMVKDAIFSICLFGMGVAIYPLIEQKEAKRTDWLMLFAFSLGVSLFRHGGLYVVILSLIILLLIRREQGKRKDIPGLITIGSVILGYLLIVIIIGRVWLHADPNPKYIKYSVPFYMAGELVADDEVQIDDEDMLFLETFADIDTWKQSHSKYWADPVAREYGMLGSSIVNKDESTYGMQLIKFNLKYFLRYPLKYIQYYGDITSILWEIARPSDGYEWGPIEGMAIDYDQGIFGAYVNGFTVLTRTISNFTGKLPILRTVIWRGGFMQFCYLLCLCYLILRKKIKYIMVAIPVILFHASLYLSIPSQDPRYVLGLVELFPFFSMIVFSAHETEKSDMKEAYL